MRFWAARAIYYRQIAGKRQTLGRGKQAAEREVHLLMAHPTCAQFAASSRSRVNRSGLRL